MAEYLIKSLKFGIDTRRDVLTSQMGTLVQCENAFINAGGEVEKRKEFLQAYDVSMFDNDALAITINRTGSTANATLVDHGLAVGDEVSIAGATQSEYNGIFTVTNVTANVFSYTVSGAPASPATGSPTVSFMGTFGLETTTDGLVVFGSAYEGGGSPVTSEPSLADPIPSGVTYKQLRHPGVGQYQDADQALYDYRYHRMTAIVFSLNFNGTYFVAARFTDGRTFLYYNSSAAIADTWDGLVLEVPNAGFTFAQVAAINFGRQLAEFEWADSFNYIYDANIDENGAAQVGSYMMKSPAGDFFGVQTEWDSDDGQIGVRNIETDGAAENGTRASTAFQISVNGTVGVVAQTDGGGPVQANLTGDVIAAGATAADTATAVVQAINDYSDVHGYQAIASNDVVIIFAPIDTSLSTLAAPLLEIETSGGATCVAATGSSSDVVGFVSPSPLEVIRQVPMPGEGWVVSAETQLFVFGGIPPYTFAWSELSEGTGNGITIEDPDDQVTSFSKAIPQNTEVTGQFKCVITAQGSVTETVYLTVTLKAVYTEGQ